ncbi:MAG TPA: hypothetical protein EYG79_08720 [Rhodobacteraceae bacterium]|nr:hypothetical protein [Paracoccaceae bacterium]
MVDIENLPQNFPTHRQSAEFWEHLGRTVATFGFLEEILGKAIFAMTATTQYSEETINDEYQKWFPKLEKALFDPLGSLIDSFGKAVKVNKSATISPDDRKSLLADLRSASKIRNVLCHGSWRSAGDTSTARPFYINRQKEIFETDIDLGFLSQTAIHVTELACHIINTVTHMGYQFPGSNGPGEAIWK